MKPSVARGTNHTSFRIVRPGVLPGFRVKPRLELLDTVYTVVSSVGRAGYIACALVCADAGIIRLRPNAWVGGVANVSVVLFGVSFAVVMVYVVASAATRCGIKALLRICRLYSANELEYFPLNSGGRIWYCGVPRDSEREWPAAWQEPLLSGEDSERRGTIEN